MSKQWLMVVAMACGTRLFAAPNDTSERMDTTVSMNVLIVKGNSYLENTVTKIVQDSLSRLGFSVNSVPLKKLGSENPANYKAIIVFSAIKVSGQLDPLVKKFIDTKSNDPSSNVMICTVYGERWGGARVKTDAVSAATKTLNPAAVAAKIVSYLTKSGTQGGTGY
jgi:hypothetical protein